MRIMLLGAAAIGAVLTLSAPAQAAQRCGGGYHRGPHGHCIPNRGHHGPGWNGHHGRPVVGVYYPGRGYWHNGRYWKHRYRHRNHWRYR